MVGKGKGTKQKQDEGCSPKDHLVPGCSQSSSVEAFLPGEEERQASMSYHQITTESSLAGFEWSCCMGKALCKGRRSTRAHQSRPEGLWKAVSFLHFSLGSLCLSCRTKYPHCKGRP